MFSGIGSVEIYCYLRAAIRSAHLVYLPEARHRYGVLFLAIAGFPPLLNRERGQYLCRPIWRVTLISKES